MTHLPPDLALMLLADARLPSAGHTQSAQLEPAVLTGLAAEDVPAYLTLRLRTVTRVEAATAVVGLHHVRQDLPLTEVETAWAARTPSPAMRETSRRMGRALLRTVQRLWPEHPATARLAARTPRALVLATVADAAGMSPVSLARLVGYDDVQTVASAALKLLPLDPGVVATWVAGALPDVDRLAREVASLTTPSAVPAAGAPQIEAWAESHAATTHRRLFSA